jgi:bzd-type benzoyl-CoA reductase N subunit
MACLSSLIISDFRPFLLCGIPGKQAGRILMPAACGKSLLRRGEEMDLEARSQRARELKKSGKKVIGYFCCYVPLEFFTALDLVPYRIWGNMQDPILEANTHFISTACPYARSCFDNALKGHYDFFDGVAGAKTCDTFDRLFQVWRYVLKPSYSHVVHVPNGTHQSSYAFLKSELQTFRDSLEVYTGRKITDGDLREAIKLHNENRRLVRELYEFRKEKPPAVSGTELARLVMAVMSLPVGEANDMLREKIGELKKRTRTETVKPRVLLWGTPVDDVSFIQLIEECGADVVMDDTCTGSRLFWHDVPETGDPLDGLVRKYMENSICPFKFPDLVNHRQDMENRYQYLKRYVRDFAAEGAVMQVVTYCAIHSLDVPDVKDYFNEMGLPALVLEYDYNAASFSALRTRVQAFVETLI